MIIGGLQKFSLLDFPEKISAIVFTQGCNFRCRFCYNPMLVWPIGRTNEDKTAVADSEKNHSLIMENDFFQFLETRQGLLEAIVITGGEPTLHKDLPDFIKKIKKLGFLIKLDTNGTNPEQLEELIKQDLLDYIAMDIKAGEENYEKVVKVPFDFKNIKKSVNIIMKNKIPYEFRTTLISGLVGQKDVEEISTLIAGTQKWFLQNFKSDIDLIDQKLKNNISFSQKEMLNMLNIATKKVKNTKIR